MRCGRWEWGRVLVIVGMALAMAATPAAAWAEALEEVGPPVADDAVEMNALVESSNAVASGKWGTCKWEIDATGKLTIHAGTGKDNSNPMPWDYPWFEHNQSIKSVVFEQGVIMPAHIDAMFFGFSGYESLVSVDARGANTSKVTSMGHLFNSCMSLETVDLSGWDVSNVESMADMLTLCGSLRTLDMSGWQTSSLKDIGSGWYYLHYDYELGTHVADTYSTGMFNGCKSLVSLDLSGWDVSKVERFDCMFGDCTSLVSLDLTGWRTSSATDMACMFINCHSLEFVDVSGWDTSNVVDMYAMFAQCYALKGLDVSGWDTSHAELMHQIFNYCKSLETLDTSAWRTPKAIRMDGIFNGCESLRSVDVSGWDTSNVTDLSWMFWNCPLLERLDVSGWRTSNVTSMCGVFDGCNSVDALDVSKWDTSKVTNMSYLFSYCTNVASLDLSHWDTSAVTEFEGMFFNDTALSTIRLGSRYQINAPSMFPEATVNDGWWSTKDGRWYTKDEIMASRSGTADTYTNVVADPVPVVSISGAKVTLGAKSYTYDGKAKAPGVRSVTLDGKELVEGFDYRVKTVPSGRRNVGTYTYVVEGIGDYTGTAEGSFTIKAASVSKANLSLSKTSFVYSGKVQRPTVKSVGGKSLKAGTDYTIEYSSSSPKAVGSYSVWVVGKGNYKGTSAKATYTIVPKGTEVTKLVPASTSITVTWKKQAAQTTGYQVQYCLRKDFKSGAKVVTVAGAKSTGGKLGKLAPKKTYYVRVRTYKKVDGKAYYSAWSMVKSAKTK